MEIEFIFENALNENTFNSLSSTSKKIRHCIEKDVFSIRKRGVDCKINHIECINFDKIDFSCFDNQEFKINKYYKTEEYIVSPNDLMLFETLKVFEHQVGNFSVNYGEIDFYVNKAIDTKSKHEYLYSILKKNNPYSLSYLGVEPYSWSKELKTAIDTWYEFSMIAGEYLLDYLFGKIYRGGSFEDNMYPKLKNLKKDYCVFLTARYCQNLIAKLKEEDSLVKIDFQKNNTIFKKNGEEILHSILVCFGSIDDRNKAIKGKFRTICDAFWHANKYQEFGLFKETTKLKDFIAFLNREDKYDDNNTDNSKLSDGKNYYESVKEKIKLYKPN